MQSWKYTKKGKQMKVHKAVKYLYPNDSINNVQHTKINSHKSHNSRNT